MIGLAVALAAVVGVVFLGRAASKDEISLPSGLGVFTLLVAAAPLLKAIFDGVTPFWSAVSHYVTDPTEVASAGAIDQVKVVLTKLVHWAVRPGSAQRRRVLVIIDDLDRCPPDVALNICVAGAQLLSIPGVIIMLLGDLAVLEEEAGRRYSPADADPATQRATGRRFIEKIVQYQLDLPVPTSVMLEDLVRSTAFRDAGDLKQKRQWRTRLAAAVTTLVTGIGLRPVPDRALRLFLTIADIAMTATVVVFVIPMAYGFAESLQFLISPSLFAFLVVFTRRAGRLKKAEHRVKAAITECIDGGLRDSRAITRQVLDRLSDDDKFVWTERLVRVQVDNALTGLLANAILGRSDGDDDQNFSFDEQALSTRLPENPRRIKRTANQIVLYLFVADRRGLFAADSGVEQAHVAKWALLSASWPEVFDCARRSPERFSVEEEQIRRGDRTTPDPKLLALLKTDPPLGPVATNLATMTPVKRTAEESHEDAHPPEIVEPTAVGPR